VLQGSARRSSGKQQHHTQPSMTRIIVPRPPRALTPAPLPDTCAPCLGKESNCFPLGCLKRYSTDRAHRTKLLRIARRPRRESPVPRRLSHRHHWGPFSASGGPAFSACAHSRLRPEFCRRRALEKFCSPSDTGRSSCCPAWASEVLVWQHGKEWRGPMEACYEGGDAHNGRQSHGGRG
jgi:hypothetical protein